MRFGFIAASLSAHLVGVCLAWRLAPEGLRQSPAPPLRSSSLQAQDVELTQWPTAEAIRTPPELAPKEEVDAPDTGRTAQGARPGPSTQRASTQHASTQHASTQHASTQHALSRTKGVAPKEASTPPSPASEGTEAQATPRGADDWMSLEQQLPESERSPQETASSQPKRDLLVERLLAKERDRIRLAELDEARREDAARRDKSAAAEPAVSVAVALPRPLEETYGESATQADLWVELTRWLPRAASSDPSWELLPTNSSYEFQVELVVEGGKLVDSRILGRAPLPAAKLVSNTRHLMDRGRYAGRKRAIQRFELRVRLSNTERRDLWIGHTAPDPPKPGVGSFIAPSGRRFDVWVSEVP